MKRKRIVILIDWYLPGYKAGGPIKSISALISHLQHEFDFYIITTNRDLGETIPYADVQADNWINISDSVKAYYFSKENLTRKKLFSVIQEFKPDIIYLNSLFSFYFSIYPLMCRRLGKLKESFIVAPRGMLGAGALQIKGFKKRIFIFISKLVGLHNTITWHATSAEESLEIATAFGKKAIIKVAMNLQYKNSFLSSSVIKKQSGTLKLFFLSRISEKKNLVFALDILSKINNNVSVEFDIIGPIENKEYWNNCLDKIKTLPKNIIVKYIGAIPNTKLANQLADYHFLFLPTRNENYGHVIVESWMNGKPVIISDQTPWKDLRSKNIGWDISLQQPELFVKTIDYCAQMGQSEYEQLSATSLKFAENHFFNPEIIAQNKHLFY